jgi:hypothetical protein
MKKHELINLIQEMVEQAIEEAVYPENFDVSVFKGLPSFAARIKYVKERLPKVAQGSARAVFIVDDQTVLKIAMNKRGLAQNKVEAEIGRHTSYPVAEVFEVGDNGVWIEMQRATKATPKLFQQLAGVDLKTFDAVITYWEIERNPGKYRGSLYRKPENYEELVSGDNDLINSVLGLMGDYDIPPGDLGRISSWGVVSRNGTQELVLIDYGLTRGVWNDYYSPKRPSVQKFDTWGYPKK